MALLVVVVAVLAVVDIGSDGDGSAAPSTAGSRPNPPATPSRPAEPVPQVVVDGTLERSGEDLVARVDATNEGSKRIWIPVGTAGSTRARLLPAAAGGGILDLGWVVPPAPGEVEGVVPSLTFRPVEPGATLGLEATDAPPPPEALVDTAGEPVEVTGYRLCVDAFADAALGEGDRTPVAGSDDVVVEVGRLDGESTRTCGPSVEA